MSNPFVSLAASLTLKPAPVAAPARPLPDATDSTKGRMVDPFDEATRTMRAISECEPLEAHDIEPGEFDGTSIIPVD